MAMYDPANPMAMARALSGLSAYPHFAGVPEPPIRVIPPGVSGLSPEAAADWAKKTAIPQEKVWGGSVAPGVNWGLVPGERSLWGNTYK